KKQEELLGVLLKRDPSSFTHREAWLTNQFSMAELEAARGERGPALERLRRALAMVEEMTRKDPTNRAWARRKEHIERDLALFQPPGSKGTGRERR
ncbi:MAG TPA: hypothetical protein VGB08_09885, partial [Allosphingosinicella sp.]